ncbi:histidine triad nucleotide-binding protein [Halieaceae bacterium IMCC14734]|uniref:Histidine triad nucleotide-binding protein n=1 Tax=Candidatus Litorirhabdus singularis TaxID=2518993 RepID=A0ABT3TFT6_9GAMM|nr:histidine triad nucleotide-binding protein [Candidatus Litorirhabdus singularis]MCX2980899.1 histidine triad nucleotide-binding protein [Candidatus Litorirhabdus singularis]
MSDTIFAKIISGEIPSEFIYEDEHCVAINDINPQAPVHVLVIPRKPITQLSAAQAEDQALLGHLLLAANTVAKQLGVDEAYRLLINNGEGVGMTVYHLHLHILAGRTMAEAQLAQGLDA